MFMIIGLVVVIGSVLGGFSIAGGNIPVLFHVSEIVCICGTSLGTVIISTPPHTLKALNKDLMGLLKPDPFNKALYLDSLMLLFELFTTAQRDGMVAIEGHIENPDESALFLKYPNVLHHHHAVIFLCDSLRLVLMGSVAPHDLDMMMDADIELHHHEEEETVTVLTNVTDGLPGIGIVAAVLGIIVTMSYISGPVEYIGHKVAAALTGTFLGVLLAYGFTGPIATLLGKRKATEGAYYGFLKAAVTAAAKDSTPMISAELARRAVASNVRPSFGEMEEACQSVKKSVAEAKAA